MHNAGLIAGARINQQQIEAKRSEEKGIQIIAPDHYFMAKILRESHPEIIEEISSIYSSINESGAIECIDCISEIQLSHARKQQLPLPFEPFENTIPHSDDERITQLETILGEQLERKGKHLGESTAAYEMTREITVWKGSVKKPLTINIYGFTDLEDQNHLLLLIDEFFKNIKENQRKIIFYKPLCWIHTVLENGMKRRTRDQKNEIVIKEIIVR